MDKIIVDFLEISRIEAARLKFNFIKADLITGTGLNLGVSAGPLFADRGYNSYYYSVEPQYATASRGYFSRISLNSETGSFQTGVLLNEAAPRTTQCAATTIASARLGNKYLLSGFFSLSTSYKRHTRKL